MFGMDRRDRVEIGYSMTSSARATIVPDIYVT
jgi:hypothetical protein